MGLILFLSILLSLASVSTVVLAAESHVICADSWNMIQLEPAEEIVFCGDIPAGMRVLEEDSLVLWNPEPSQIGEHSLKYVTSFAGNATTNSLVLDVKKTETALCILAHSDDEFGICAKIKRMVDDGVDVSLAWTSLHRKQRIDESRQAMLSVGVKPENMHFWKAGDIASTNGFYSYMQNIGKLLERHSFDQIYIPAYEGGHVQHDLTHAATVAACRYRDYRGQVYEFGLYHLKGPLPMLFSLLPAPSPTIQVSLDDGEMRFIETLSRSYETQKHVTAGFRLGMSRKKKMHPAYRPLPAWDYTRPPHKGMLWYAANFKHPASFEKDFFPAVCVASILTGNTGRVKFFAQDNRKGQLNDLILPDRRGDKVVRIRNPLSVYACSFFVFVFGGVGWAMWRIYKWLFCKCSKADILLSRINQSPPASGATPWHGRGDRK